MLFEELKVKSDIEEVNTNFRKYLSKVFNTVFIKKLDRVFKEPLVVETFKKNNNVHHFKIGTHYL